MLRAVELTKNYGGNIALDSLNLNTEARVGSWSTENSSPR